MDKISIWIPVIVALVATIPSYIGVFKGHESRKYIHKALLRSDMFTILEISRERGYRTEASIMHFNELYNLYKKIGGNSYGEEIVEDFKKIPKQWESDTDAERK